MNRHIALNISMFSLCKRSMSGCNKGSTEISCELPFKTINHLSCYSIRALMYDTTPIGGESASTPSADELTKKGFSCISLEKSSLGAYNAYMCWVQLVQQELTLPKVIIHAIKAGKTTDTIESHLRYTDLFYYKVLWRRELHKEELKYTQKLPRLI